VLAELDQLMWSFSPAEFVPHCRADASQSTVAATPVVLAESPGASLHHGVLVNLGQGIPAEFERFERFIEVVARTDDDRLAARSRWKHYTDRGYAMKRHDLATAGGQAHEPPTTPPRFVPTLTEVIRPLPASPPAPENTGGPLVTPAPAKALAVSADLQEQMVQRVLQRVDLVLERRLREVVGQLILEHTQTLTPRLREEIEAVVRQSVNQAFESEAAPPAGAT
jgi:DNA polymerase-3 subunit chi